MIIWMLIWGCNSPTEKEAGVTTSTEDTNTEQITDTSEDTDTDTNDPASPDTGTTDTADTDTGAIPEPDSPPPQWANFLLVKRIIVPLLKMEPAIVGIWRCRSK